MHIMKKIFTRKIVKNGRGSYYINIPKYIIEEFWFRERQKLDIKKVWKKIIITDWED